MTVLTASPLVERLRAIVGKDAVLSSPGDLLVYECDGYTIEKNRPDVVVFPTSTEQVVQVVRLCNELDVPFLARGAGTSLAGGCLPVGGGVMIALTRMKRILEVNYRDRYAVVEPGVVNLWLTNHLKPQGYHFAPDPSSQGACTIGGNVATNSGGPHTLKYGVTVNHVLGLELVLPDGRVITTGGPCEDSPGYDLTGVIVGCEGTFGIVSKTWVRITRNPEAYRTLLGVFDNVDDATNTISDIIGAGIVPGALEMLDQLILKAVEEAFHFGFPLDAGAVVIMEVDGLEAGLDTDAERITEIARRNGASEVRRAGTDDERDADQVRRVLDASREILDECIACGGSVTGEHGIGVEKIDFMPKLFSPEDLEVMIRLRRAFNPENRCSPEKMLPTSGACHEPSRIHRHAPGRRAAL
jgi:glycolate oxidase